MSFQYSLGFDFGTSGVRSCCISQDNYEIIHEGAIGWSSLPCPDPSPSSHESWLTGLDHLLLNIPSNIRDHISRICVSGTSSSALIYDFDRKDVTRSTRMYNFNILASTQYGEAVLNDIRRIAPSGSSANSATSTLAKLLSWHKESPLSVSEILIHQSDFISGVMLGHLMSEKKQETIYLSDWHNSLKLGYDVKTLSYPSWLNDILDSYGIDLNNTLPVVKQPGTLLGIVDNLFAEKYNLNKDCEIMAGTTDSIAAFLAAGATKPGQAVTSLGSTLAVKLLSEVPVEDSDRGIYSHRLGDQWLVGGASNTGCKILRDEKFSEDELVTLSEGIDPQSCSGFTYYPLSTQGERFPINDPRKLPVLEPKPLNFAGEVDRRLYLHGILEGIAEVEKLGYDALNELGATPLSEVFTCGGGAKNSMWMKMRSFKLGVPCSRARNADAAFGVAKLAFMYQ